MKDIFDLIARIFLSLIFLWEAYDSIKYYKSTKAAMTGYGVTWNQDLLLSSAIFLMIFGGILILTGYRAKFGAVLLLLFYVPATFIIYSFWNDPEELYRENSIQFMKNLAIIGGLMTMYVNGAGRYSVKRLFATTRLPRNAR
ncbi:MAG: DoxX family protein [Bacteroidota bacterium]